MSIDGNQLKHALHFCNTEGRAGAELDLSSCGLEDFDLHELMRTVRSLSHLASLDLRCDRILVYRIAKHQVFYLIMSRCVPYLVACVKGDCSTSHHG